NVRNSIKVAALLLLDLAAFYCSLLAAYYSRAAVDLLSSRIAPFQLSLPYFLHIWWLPAIFISFIAYERLYYKKLPFWDETREVLKALSASTIAILAIITLGKMSDKISRLTIIFLWCWSLFIYPLFRLAGKKFLYRIKLWQDNVIIIGAGAAGRGTAKGIASDIHLGYHVIGFLDDDEQIGTRVNVDGTIYKIFGKIRHFKKFVQRLDVSTVIIAIPSLSSKKLSELTSEIQKYTKSVLLVPDIKGVALTNTELYHLFVQQLFLLKINNNLKSPFNRFIKRTFDLTVSVVFLPLLLLIIGILGLLIKLDSRGPVFYRHTRIGRSGKPFGVYKFRSMYLDSRERLEHILSADPASRQEWETYFKLRNDPRITGMGNFLRRTSLDELPQIFNVLKGEMSLVGPRPVLQEEITKYYKEDAAYYNLVRPGISGLWQVSGRNTIDYDKRVRLDTWYVLNWSVWLDITILFKTLGVVLKKEGAY
ncbi:MAG: undecaprenyl-phosphate galactose phosphotransferase WbaP, partial [Nitrospiraceae bacterium]|nr:undecaprenyl-phosphate galactose phosphotransferase WbaP [Nitrospiraceae bacterium]